MKNCLARPWSRRGQTPEIPVPPVPVPRERVFLGRGPPPPSPVGASSSVIVLDNRPLSYGQPLRRADRKLLDSTSDADFRRPPLTRRQVGGPSTRCPRANPRRRSGPELSCRSSGGGTVNDASVGLRLTDRPPECSSARRASTAARKASVRVRSPGRRSPFETGSILVTTRSVDGRRPTALRPSSRTALGGGPALDPRSTGDCTAVYVISLRVSSSISLNCSCRIA